MGLRALVLSSLALAGCASDGAPSAAAPSADPWTRLAEGNRRYVAGALMHKHDLEAQRRGVAESQAPFAMILSCADSRVAPEYVFDQGVGDLFVVRVAGNVSDPHGLGSLEFAAATMGSKILVVMGHERCGAVKASMTATDAPGNVGSLVRTIAPGLRNVRHETGDALDDAVRENVRQVVAAVRKDSPALAAMEREGKIRIVGARYDLDTGEVTLVE
jgi:carbonic anhydrase